MLKNVEHHYTLKITNNKKMTEKHLSHFNY